MTEKDMLLLRVWDGREVHGWLASEKLDGCRAYWDGESLWTRGGNRIAAPQAFTTGLPACHLDGEIWAGRGQLKTARLATQYGTWTSAIRFAIFDAPQESGGLAARLDFVRADLVNAPLAFVVENSPLKSFHQIRVKLTEVWQSGGEGLVLRNPIAAYERKRTWNAVKVK